ncbi:GNAT family N-acetyltransferase [Jiangella asiatica]|uniref:N-acetyltransferase n=1 Tax=Jiangella asiatica TaxID=2530372 RepID=A0A4R5D7D0_9ACTN|nr:GNAT family N-acetyltransferase [Jiangella asiatica]TDE09316.1 N-acetyltransferase [Jiangella asiatica]
MQTLSIESHEERPIVPGMVIALFRNEDWWPHRTAADMAAVLRTSPAVAAWQDDTVVGFARAVTDGRLRAYVEDVIVHPEVRGRGIGASLVRKLHELLHETISPLTLFSAAHLAPYYERLGYRPTRQVVLHHHRAV